MIPRVHVGWRDVWIGAGVTSALFVLGKFLIGLYIGKSDMTSSFGAAGSMVLVMVWVYWSAQIFLFGAEFTWVYANLYGSRKDIAKKEGTVPGAPQEVPAKSEENTGAPAADAKGAAPTAARKATDPPPMPIGTVPLTR
jgi:membrane protein